MIGHARSRPGKMTFAVGSIGSAGHLSTELLKRAGDISYTVVPYKGTAPAFQDLIGGRVNFICLPEAALLSLNAPPIRVEVGSELITLVDPSVGGRLMEFAGSEYMVRVKGYSRSIADFEQIVVKVAPGGHGHALREITLGHPVHHFDDVVQR